MDELTPEEQRELELLRKGQGATIGPSSDKAYRVETPNSLEGLLREQRRNIKDRFSGKIGPEPTPAEMTLAGSAVNSVANAQISGMPGLTQVVAAPVKAAGRGIRSLADFFGGRIAGLKSGKEIATYQAAPRTVEALSKAPELRKQQFAERALESVSDRLGFRAKDLSGQLSEQFSGKFVNPAEIAAAEKFGPKPSASQLVSGEGIPADEVYRATQKAGEAAKFAPNPIDPLAERARAEAAGKEFAVLRGAVGKAAPEAEPTIASLKEGIEAQQALKPGAAKPAALFENASTDMAAARQQADELVGSTRLDRTANQMQTARQLSNNSGSFWDKFLKPVGRAELRASSTVAPVASKAADLGAFLGSRGAINAGTPRIQNDPNTGLELTPEEQAELEQLRKLQR
jgi:hypothetical protein